MTWEFFPECDDRMDPGFMERLIGIRRIFNKPMPITSSFRTPEVNESIGGSPNSTHLLGRAIDCHIAGGEALELLEIALANGMTGIGLRQHGHWPRRFIHLDDVENPKTRPRIWTYP